MTQNTTISNEEPRVLGFRVQTSAYGLTVPVVWGTARIQGNLLWYNDFTAIPHTTSTTTATGGGGGKGGGGGGGSSITQSNTTYTYTAAVMLALGWGPINAIGAWKNKDRVSVSSIGSFFSGSANQTPWGYLQSMYPAQALAYRDIAYIANATFDLGSDGSLPQFNFEVQGRKIFPGTQDADPSEIILDVLTDPRLGVGFPTDAIGNLADYAMYCRASRFFLSPALAAQSGLHSFFEQILLATNSEIIDSGGLIKIIPYGDAAVSSPFATWSPNMTPQYDLDDDDFCPALGEDPVRVIRKSPADAYNQVRVEYNARSNEYNTSVIERKDQANIEQFGLRPKSTDTLHLICRDDTASDIADIIMRRSLYVRNEYEFELSWRHCLLEPMDFVTITDTAQGLNRKLVRLIEVVETDDGGVSIRAEEVPGVTASAANINTEPPAGTAVDFNAAPGNAHTPVIFEPPVALTEKPQVWIAVSGESAWGGCEIWLSTDDTHYSRLGTMFGKSRHGVLTQTLSVGADPDIINTVMLDMSLSRGQLVGGTQEDRDLYNTLSHIGGELISYQTATLTGLDTYDLTNLRRGAYGTTIGTHAVGTPFVRCDAGVFRTDYDPALVGKTIFIKLRSFNIYGGGIQNLEDLAAAQYTIQGVPLDVVSGLVQEGVFDQSKCAIKWTRVIGAVDYTVEVWTGGALRRTSRTVDTRYAYTAEDADSDGGLSRSVTFRVKANGLVSSSPSWTQINLTNAQIAAPVNARAEAGFGSVVVAADMPSENDYKGTLVWAGDDNTFANDAAHLIYDGPDVAQALKVTPGTTRWFRMAHYDVFGKDNLNSSGYFSAQALSFGGVPTVSETPGVTYLDSDVVFSLLDDSLFVWNVDHYERAQPQVVANQITSIDLKAISAIVGEMLLGKMVLDAFGFVRGGQTDYNTGNGFWLGYKSGEYKMSMANAQQDRMTFDTTGLKINGNLQVTSELPQQLMANGDFDNGLTDWYGFDGSLTPDGWTATTFDSQSCAAGQVVSPASGDVIYLVSKKVAVQQNQIITFDLRWSALNLPAGLTTIMSFYALTTSDLGYAEPAVLGDGTSPADSSNATLIDERTPAESGWLLDQVSYFVPSGVAFISLCVALSFE